MGYLDLSQGTPKTVGTIAAQPLHQQAEKGRWQWRARVHCLGVCSGAGANTAPAGAGDGVTSVARLRDSGGAGEPAGLTKMSGSMRRFVQVVKHYPGQQQASSRSIYRSGSRCPALGLAEPRWDLSTPVTDVRSTRRRQSSTRRFANFRALHCGHARSRVLGGGGACARACLHTTCRAELSRAGLALGIGGALR